MVSSAGTAAEPRPVAHGLVLAASRVVRSDGLDSASASAAAASTQSPPAIEQLQVEGESTGGHDAIAGPEPTYPTGTKFWFTVITLGMVLILGGLDVNIVATAVPSITDHFHTVADVGWYAAAFRLSTCGFQFGFAKAYTLFSVKRVFMFSNVLFLVGSLLCASAQTSAMFVAGRAVTGMGFAGELSGCFAVATYSLPLNRRPILMSLMACVESLAIIAAPIVGGALTQSLGWRWCFWINLPMGFLSLATIFFLFSDPERSSEQTALTLMQKIQELDVLSNCLFFPALTSLFIALSWGGTKYAWSDTRVIVPFVAFVLLFTAFLINQHRRGDAAALPFRIIRNRNVIAGFIFTTFTNSMTNVLEWYLPTYYQVVRGKTPSESGFLMIPILFGMMLGLFLQGIGTTAIGYYAPFMIFASICMPLAAGLMTTYDLHTPLAQVILVSGFAGFSGGIGFQGSQAAIQTTLPPGDISHGTGVILFGQSFGPAVFIAIAQVIFARQLATSIDGLVPGLSQTYIEEHGLGDIVKNVPSSMWDAVLQDVDRSLTHTWYLATGLGCVTMVGSLLVEWRSVKRKRS